MSTVKRPVESPAVLRSKPVSRRRRFRRLALVLSLFGGFVLVTQLGGRFVVANTTSSVDPGLYLWHPTWLGGNVNIGGLVSLRMPESARPYFAERAGQPLEAAADWYLIKPIAAGPGDTVDTTGDRVLVNGHDLGPIYDADDVGRALPRVRVSKVLGDGEWLLVSRRCPGSLDGRYFGPVTTADLEATRLPLVRWGEETDGGWSWFGSYVDGPWRDGQAAGCPQTKVQ